MRAQKRENVSGHQSRNVDPVPRSANRLGLASGAGKVEPINLMLYNFTMRRARGGGEGGGEGGRSHALHAPSHRRVFDGHFASSENRCSPALIIIIARATSQRSGGSRTMARYYLTVIVSVISKVSKTARNFNDFLIIARSAPLPVCNPV